MLTFKQIFFLRKSWLVGKTRLDVLTFTHLVNRWKIILLHRTTPYSALWQPWLVRMAIFLCVDLQSFSKKKQPRCTKEASLALLFIMLDGTQAALLLENLQPI